MAFGLDYSMGMPPVADMKAAGVSFVCRYVGYTSPTLPQTKILTLDEAKTLGQGGLALVSNWEWYAERALEGAASGVWDAQEAQRRHASCGGPPSRPIYFSADLDVDGSQTAEYFKGVASGIGLPRTGAYGSYRVLKYLFDAGLITWGWQTYAWSGGQWEPRAHIQQYSNSVIMSGIEVDYDRSMAADFGQWTIGGMMSTLDVLLQHGWSLSTDKTVLYSPNKVPIRTGFKLFIENAPSWDPADWALAPEFATGQLEASNTSLGAGSQQIFRWTMLGYTTQRGVFEEWLGQELAYCRSQVAKYYAQVQQLTAQASQDTLQIQQLKDELAKATASVVQGIDPAAVKDRLAAIGLAAGSANTAIQQLVNQSL